MKGRSLLGVVAILLAATAARADTVVLKDGREIQGDVTYESGAVVVSRANGSARFATDLVARVYSAKKDTKADAEAQKQLDAAKQEKALRERQQKALLEALESKKKFEPLPAAEALHWEKDAKEARRLAAERKKIVLVFSVLGELGTGHC